MVSLKLRLWVRLVFLVGASGEAFASAMIGVAATGVET
jgi:hypothetical protein